MPKVSVLIPTYNRAEALAMTLTALSFQEFQDFDIIVADQGDQALAENTHIQAIQRILELHGTPLRIKRNLPRRGVAQQRQFLLDQCGAPYCLYIDDDVILEPYAIRNLLGVIEKESCGFVGMPLIGPSFKDDVRPHQQNIEFWEGPVKPEVVTPDSPGWQRYELHNAANALHVQRKLGLSADSPRTYKVAWIGGCVLFDTAKLQQSGGYSFWTELPAQHCGEDVLAQLRVMKRYGGCGILPSGAYHQELPTTIPQEDRKVDAPKCLTI